VIVVFVMGLVSAEDSLDVSIVPLAYFGGFIFLLLARPLPRGWVMFKYSEDTEYKDLVTAEWLDSP